MSILLGTGTFQPQGDTFLIQPPTRFDAVEAVRITNYTGDALILTNITGDGQDQQYLMPYQQMVYRTANVTRPPTMQGVSLGAGIDPDLVFVEWSSEGPKDFPGTYPTSVAIPPLFVPTGVTVATDTIAVPNDGSEVTLPPIMGMLDRTFINQGPDIVQWRGNSVTNANPITLPVGASATVGNNSRLYFSSVDMTSGATVDWFGDTIT